MKRILMLCGSYLPKASPNGICVSHVAHALRSDGHAVTVAAFAENSKQVNAIDIIGDIPVWRINPGYIGNVLNDTAASGRLVDIIRRKTALSVSRLAGALNAFRYPLHFPSRVRYYFQCAEKLNRENPVDVLVCCYHNIYCVVAGMRFKKKYPKTKLVVYSLDAISGGWVPAILHSKRIPMESLKRWERKIFATADKLFAMESHRGYYLSDPAYEQYMGKIDFLDIPMLIPAMKERVPHHDKVRMVYTGSMHMDTANPRYLLKLLPMIEQAELYIYGAVCPEIEAMIKSHPLFDKRIFLCGRVAHSEIAAIQQEADVLLNFGNGNPNMIPCKIFEYMSTGNRILSFTYSDTDSSLPYMRQYPTALIVSENNAEQKENAERIKRFLAEERPAPTHEELFRLFEKNTPAYFCKRLLEV